MGAGYDDALNIQYDEKYRFGNTTVYVVAPVITEEEQLRRLRELEATLGMILQCQVTLKKVVSHIGENDVTS